MIAARIEVLWSERGSAPMRFCAAVLVVLALLWLAGLMRFVARVDLQVSTNDPSAQGIVVLTGGGDRLNAALGLLKRGRAQRLLITGVHPDIKATDLSDVTIGTKELFGCCVDLGTSARNTRGNALEAEQWARAHRYTQLIIVTANYHMPRSLLEFHAAMPDVQLIPYPVVPRGLVLGGWWLHPATVLLLAGEYSKYLLSAARIHTFG